MKIKFTQDFANNWKAGDIVNIKYIDRGEVLVDDVAIINLNLLLKHCIVLSKHKYDVGVESEADN